MPKQELRYVKLEDTRSQGARCTLDEQRQDACEVSSSTSSTTLSKSKVRNYHKLAEKTREDQMWSRLDILGHLQHEPKS